MAAFLIAAIAGALLVWRELAWRRTAAALRAEHDRLRRELRDVSGLAQDLKSPLQGVIGNTELMIATAGAASPVDELRDIRDNAARAAGIVRTLSAVAGTAELSRTWQDLNQVVTRAVDGCRAELGASGVRVDFDRADRLPLVYVDGGQLERVLTLLMSRPAPRSTARRQEAAVRLATHRREGSDDRLVIEFDDPTLAPPNAAPASADVAACRHIVEAHGGSLAVEQPGLGGYRFVLELPVWTT